MEEKDREIWVGENRFYLGEDNILYGIVVGEIDEKIAIEIRRECFKLVNMVEGKVNCLLDINKVGKPLVGARKVGRKFFENEKVEKIAIFGLHPVARVIASFIMGASKKEDIHFFNTKEEALVWLKSESS